MKVVFLGCGNMGTALLKSALQIQEVGEIIVVEKRDQQRQKLSTAFGEIKLQEQIPSIKDPCLIIIAVKPQDIEDLVVDLKEKLLCRNVGILSIAAGITRDFYYNRLGELTVIRAMPNTPGLLGAGITAVIYEKQDFFAELSCKILEGLGDVVQLNNEELMDVVTAVSGSGPAYFFYLVEVLSEFAIESGLQEDVAEKLARKTCYGAGLLLERMDLSAKRLREMVTSKGGTTESAINYMTQNGISDILKEAFAQAVKRAKELAR